jgi:hypothetical protein
METTDKIGIKVFDGEHFSIWKCYMEILFEAKKVLQVANGRELRHNFNPPPGFDITFDEQK